MVESRADDVLIVALGNEKRPLNMSVTITARNVDLSNCDREQIQFPGAILPHGVLLTLREPGFTILQASQNTATLFCVAASELIGKELTALLATKEVEFILNKLQAEPLVGPPFRISLVEINGMRWNLLAHRCDQVVFLEFDPSTALQEPSVTDLYLALQAAITRLQNTRSLQQFLDLAVQQIRTFTGFDRVMAYKFLHDGSGWVRSESVIEGQPAYLGQHFPPSDVPAPAKRLFSMSWLRHQPDIGYTPVPLVPENNPVTGGPLDMSSALLRSVSVMYTGYLKNMGTHSSMVMTVLKDGKLWGLIACHHHARTRHVPYEVRTACEFIANMVSLLIAEKEDLEFTDYKLKLKTTQSGLIETLSKREPFAISLIHESPNLLDFIRSSGAAVVHDDGISLIGETPTQEQVHDLVQWLSANNLDEVYACDSLAAVFPAAQEYKDVASGVLAIRFAATKQDYLLWFRPEVLQTVKWAGDPHKPVDISSDGERLLPRTSFALWRETVKLKCEPWLELETKAARELRVSILELVLRQTEELGELYKTLERTNLELDAFAYVASHDLKEPLRGIHNYARFLLEDCADRLQPEDVEKLRAMARLSKRMDDLLDSLLHYSRINRNEVDRQNTDINKIIDEVLDLLSARLSESGARILIPRPLPTLLVDPSSISEVFSNLISNALKYNDKAEKWVEISYEERPGQSPILYVRDNGIGIEPEHQDAIFMIFRRLHGPKEFGGGTGAGLTIARRIVARHGGKLWVHSTPGVGSTFCFTVD